MKQWTDFVAQYTGFPLSESQIRAFELFETELLAWNSQFNLTAIREPDDIHIKHFLDSLSCAAATGDLNGRTLIDVGTGAGFPGIPLKIVYPELKLTLVDSVGKKLKFCQHVVEKFGLRDCEIIHARAEDLGHNPVYRERYDFAVARALTGMQGLSELLLPFVQKGGLVLAQKGDTAENELLGARNAIHILGGHEEPLIAINLPGVPEKRYLVKIRKQSATPAEYPRRPDQIRKTPLS